MSYSFSFNPNNVKRVQSDIWMRECQECGYRGIYRNPKSYKDNSWRDVKCKKCGSEGLDYGSYHVVEEKSDEH